MRSYSQILAVPRWSRKAQIIQRLRKARQRKTGLILAGASPLSTALPEMLNDLAIKVVSVESEADFLSVFAKKKPDVAFIDASVHLDWKTLSYLTPFSEHAHVASIIACVGRGHDKAVIEAMRSGADDYLVMPFDFTLLRSKLACLGLCSL